MLPFRLTVLLALAAPAALRSQDSGLLVQPDPKFAVAQSLCGEWRCDEALSKRLGSVDELARLEFRADFDFVAKIPAAIAANLREKQARIYQQGTMVLGEKSHPYLLTVIDGNPVVLLFRERNGDPLGDTRSFLVAIARGAKQTNDVLMLGESAESPTRAFVRRSAVPWLEPAAVVTHMTQLIEANKIQEFIETYASPDDRKRLTDQGKKLADVVARFDEAHRTELIAMLESVAKREPNYNAARDEVTWPNESGKGPKELKLRVIDGRWYIKER